MKEATYTQKPEWMKPKDAWDALSMKEKAAMMEVAVKHGITNLKEIRNQYNEFAEGGDTEEDTWTMQDEANYRQWREALPDNLRNTNDDLYDMRGAYKAGLQPTLESDGYYHLGSRDPETGRILKSPSHPTYLQAIAFDAGMGYYPTVDNKGRTYTNTWEGNLFGGGGYKPSDSIKGRIARWEGKAMTGAIDPLSGKWDKNRSFEAEARDFTSALPESIRQKVLDNPDLADNLFSYSYNVGANNFRKRVVPALEKYYAGKGSIKNVTDSMWASGDAKLRGLRSRRKEEREGVLNALAPAIPSFVPQDNLLLVNPYVLEQQNTTLLPQTVPDEDSYITVHEVLPEEQRARNLREAFNQKVAFDQLMNILSIQSNPTPEYRPKNAPYIVRSLGGPLVDYAMKHVYGEGGNLFYPGGTITYGAPHYLYDENNQMVRDENGKPVINYNAILSDIAIVPDSRKSPADRNEDERFRQKLLKDYAEQKDKEWTENQKLAAKKKWEASVEKKVLDYSQAAASGIGVGADIVSGLPVYSSLKGASMLSKARTPLEYIEGGLWLSPGIGNGYQTIKPVVKDAINAAVENGTVWDAYTTLGGRLGNYGNNILTRAYGTFARRLGLPDKARIPADTMRKLVDEPYDYNGLVDFTGTKNWFNKPSINTSLDRPVVSHASGWDGMDTYIFPTKDFIAQTKGSLKSIEPSDMFSNGKPYMTEPSKVTLISGDVEALNHARARGMQTLSSPRLRRLYREAEEKYISDPISNKHPKKETHWLDYATEVQRLQSKRGTPTLADFRVLEEQTGLNAGVAPIAEYQNALDKLGLMKSTMYRPGGLRDIQNGVVKPYVYPNGREVDWIPYNVDQEINAVKRAKYNNVFYDPTSYVESVWRGFGNK